MGLGDTGVGVGVGVSVLAGVGLGRAVGVRVSVGRTFGGMGAVGGGFAVGVVADKVAILRSQLLKLGPREQIILARPRYWNGF